MIKDAKPMKLQFVSQVEQLKYFVRRCIAALLVGVILMLAMFILNIAYEGADKKEKKVSNYLYQFRDASELLTFSVQSYVITGDKQYYDLYINELNVEKHRDDAISGLQDCHLKDDEMNAILSISDISNALAEVENKTFEAGNNNEWEKARQMVFDSNYLERVLEIKNKTADSISTITTRLNNNRRILKYIQIVFVILFVFSLWVLESHCRKTMKFSRVELLEPIVKVSDYMEQISKGDLSIPLDMKEDDSEVGHMVSAINKMRISNADIIREISMLLEQMGSGNYKIEVRCNYEGDYIQIKKSLIKISEDMKKIVSTIQDAAKDIGDGSSQLATVSDDLAQSCVTQASQLSDVMMLINTLEESINYNEKEAEEAAKISRSSRASLDVSTAKMEELKTAIGEIYKRSDEINEIVASIEEIASETDLLSLNAAIEAARAGEAGRGFSVVAEQVKKLSEESAEAARQTAQLIAITISAVEEGIRLADEAVTDTEEVLVGTQETTDRIDRVVEKLRLEVESMQQITDSINMVAGLVDNNSMTADETAMVSTQQRDQAGMLVDLVGQLEI